MPWSANERDEIVKALAVTCEVTSTSLSGPAKTYLLAELESYSAADVLQGLRRAGRECKGKLSLSDIVKAIEFVDRKALSDARAARSAFLTRLRGCALIERIPWDEVHPEKVQEELEAKGYKFGTTPKQVRSLPHWTENDEA